MKLSRTESVPALNEMKIFAVPADFKLDLRDGSILDDALQIAMQHTRANAIFSILKILMLVLGLVQYGHS